MSKTAGLHAQRLHPILPLGCRSAGLVLALVAAGCSRETDAPRETALPPEPSVERVASRTLPRASAAQPGEFAPGILYTNHVDTNVPWFIEIVRASRVHPELTLHSAVARGVVCGLSTLSDVVHEVPSALGAPLAGINGDFFERDRAYAGDPRGLQIVAGDLLSAPTGGAALWLDSEGRPHADDVQSAFRVTWPDGSTTAFGLNEARRPDAAVLYTASLGPSTRTTGGREIVLERADAGPWYPLPAGERLKARIKEVREAANTRLVRDSMVLSIGQALASRLPPLKVGDTLELFTDTTPDLRGSRTAIGGGPVLLREGRVVTLVRPPSLMAVPYSIRSRFERHPRTAVGWNDEFYYLLQVDGRQRDRSMGMTLAELSQFMLDTLKCTHAVNLDGGGFSTFWADGRTRNHPCEGSERNLANALLVLHKPASAAQPGGAAPGSRVSAAPH